MHSCPLLCTPVRFCALLCNTVHSCAILYTYMQYCALCAILCTPVQYCVLPFFLVCDTVLKYSVTSPDNTLFLSLNEILICLYCSTSTWLLPISFESESEQHILLLLHIFLCFWSVYTVLLNCSITPNTQWFYSKKYSFFLITLHYSLLKNFLATGTLFKYSSI